MLEKRWPISKILRSLLVAYCNVWPFSPPHHSTVLLPGKASSEAHREGRRSSDGKAQGFIFQVDVPEALYILGSAYAILVRTGRKDASPKANGLNP